MVSFLAFCVIMTPFVLNRINDYKLNKVVLEKNTYPLIELEIKNILLSNNLNKNQKNNIITMYHKITKDGQITLYENRLLRQCYNNTKIH